MDDLNRYLQEDLGKKGDITSNALFSHEHAHAFIISKDVCLVAGLEEAIQVFKKTHAQATALVSDGTPIKKGARVLEINGLVRSILSGERLALNFIGRMSGIASETHYLMTRCRIINPKITIAATRKTTPGFRKYEKKAIVLGGGETHRMGLYDAIMIKDNHLKIAGSVEAAIRKIQKKLPDKPIEIEVENEHDALLAARLHVHVVMLDNFSPTLGKKVTEKIRQINPRIIIEASGGITRDNIEEYAVFADRISLGYLTHSIKNKDFSLEIIPQ